MPEDLIMRRPEGVVAIIADSLYHIRPPGNRKDVRRKREKILKQLKSDQTLPEGFPSPKDFTCKVSEIKKIILHKNGSCDIYSESKHAIKFTNIGQANSFAEHLKSFGTWNQSKSQSGFQWRIDALVCLIVGGGLAALAFGFHQGDWANFDESEVTGVRAGRKQAFAGIAKIVVNVFGQNAFLWLAISLAVLTAVLMILACRPKETTVLEQA